MYKRAAKKITAWLIGSGVVDAGEREAYAYGFEILISTAVSLTTIFALSLIVRQFLPSLFFVLGFISARLCCGGFHAKRHVTCFLTTLVNYLLFVAAAAFLPPGAVPAAILVTLFISAPLIFILAPAEHPYNPLSERERKRHRLRSRALVLALAAVCAASVSGSLFLRQVLSIGLGIFSVAVSLLLERIESRRTLNV